MSEDIRIAVCTPLGKYGNINIDTANFCQTLNGYKNVTWIFTKTNAAELSRNILIENSLSDSFTHYLFIDSDTVPPMESLSILLSENDDFVICPTPLYKAFNICWNVRDESTGEWWDINKPFPEERFETSSCGGSMLFVKKQVLVDIGYPWFKTEYQPKDNKNKVVKTGEDVWFCNRARECGYNIKVEPRILCEHYNEVGLLNIVNIIKQLTPRG